MLQLLGRLVRPATSAPLAAVSVSSGGTVQGRVIARDLDGRVTVQTPFGNVTGRAVAPSPLRREASRQRSPRYA